MIPDLRRPLIIGNWKMNNTIAESIKLVTALKNLLVDSPHIDVAVVIVGGSKRRCALESGLRGCTLDRHRKHAEPAYP